MTNNTKNFLGKYWHWFFIGAAIIVSLYIRIVNPWDSVFTWTVRLSGNDPWYYYRLVQNCLAHFPTRIWFDSFTQYPYGTFTHFGPFLVYLSAILAKLGGANTPEAVRGILAFIPAIGGTLLVFPAYLFTRELFNKKAGVLAALLIIMVPGQLLHRSVLSFNDHHIWEVFWMITVLALFTYSVNKWKGRPANLNIRSNSLVAPVFSGLALGMYLYAWAPGFIIALILLFSIFIIYLIKHWTEAETDNLAYIGIITFLVASVVFLPFAFKYTVGIGNTTRYSPFQLIVLLSSAFLLAVFYLIEILEKKGYYSRLGIKEKYSFPATIIVVGAILVSIMALIAPSFFNTITGILGVVQKTGGALTVAEVQPFFTMGGGQFSLFPAWSTFATTFFFAIPGLIYVLLRFIIKERNHLYLIAVVWGIAMLIALAGQNRFAYYFGAVSAIFAAIMLDAILRYLNFYEAVTGGIEKLKKVGYIRLAVSILIILAVFYPTLTMANQQSQYAGGMPKPWFDTLTWMRNNTPGQDFYDQYYYQVYEPHREGKYPYPQETYGVMSWWDYGHWIEAVAHRMPNANPFQQGIGSKYRENNPGAAPFFTAFNESYANNISDQLGVKYVLTDVQMATGKFYAMGAWAEGNVSKVQDIYYKGGGYVYSTPKGQVGIATSQWQIPSNAKVLTRMNIPSENYYRTMEARFHIFDGDGLKHYRMVYESNYQTQRGLTMEILNRLIYNRYYAQQMEQEPVDIRSTGYVKVFEHVDGAKITGSVGEDVSSVKLNTTIQTNQGRTYAYQQKAEPVDGEYQFTVPYAQNTTYPVKPVTPYTITAGNLTKTISLSDEDLEGETITLNLT